jgi:tetratricopeptide (TPR) repeat protein
VEQGSPEYTSAVSDRAVLYAQSWAVVHHAFHAQPQRWDELLSFLAKVTGGMPTDLAFKTAYGFELSRLERELQGYVQRPAYEYSPIPFSERIVTRIQPETTRISDAEAEAWLGDLLAHMNRDEEAAARLRNALSLDANLALAHGSLGALLIRQGHSADGMGHLEKAVSLGTANEAVYYTYAQALMSGGAADAQRVGRAVEALERAVKIRPGFNEATELLGLAYLSAGKVPAARDILSGLVRIEPANHRAALGLVEASLRLNDLDAAAAQLEPVLARATDAGLRSRALSLLAASAGLQSRRMTFAAAGLPLPADPPRLNVSAAFRRLQAGERRVYGILERIDCDADGVSIVVQTASARLSARAPSLNDVGFIAYDAARPRAIRCGGQDAAEIYLTWRPSEVPGIATTGAAVAVEILPVGFVPAP